MRTVPGADQPDRLLFRQERYPFPYFPPNMKAPVLSAGTITMQFAFSSISCGIPLSGVAMTSENTAADSSSRFADSLSIASSGVSNGVIARAVTIVNFICCAFSVAGCCATSLLVHALLHLDPGWLLRRITSAGATSERSFQAEDF